MWRKRTSSFDQKTDDVVGDIMANISATATFPENLEEVFKDANGEKTTGFLGVNQDGTWTVFFTYEGPDDRFVYGALRHVTYATAAKKYDIEKLRHTIGVTDGQA